MTSISRIKLGSLKPDRTVPRPTATNGFVQAPRTVGITCFILAHKADIQIRFITGIDYNAGRQADRPFQVDRRFRN